MLKISGRSPHDQLLYNNEYLFRPVLPIVFVVIEKLSHVFSLLNEEKLLSHSQDVTRNAQSNFKRKNKCGNLPSAHCFIEDSKSTGRSSTCTTSYVLSTILPPDQSPHGSEFFSLYSSMTSN